MGRGAESSLPAPHQAPRAEGRAGLQDKVSPAPPPRPQGSGALEQGQRSPADLPISQALTEGVRAEDEAPSRLVSAEKPGPPSREFLEASYQQVRLTASTKGPLQRRTQLPKQTNAGCKVFFKNVEGNGQ